MAYLATDLIGRKRDGGELTPPEISWLLAAYLDGGVEDVQMAALLMAGVIRGFTDEEAIALTDALVASGECLDLGELTGPTVDKHSTGGVGDTTTLVVGPVLAAAGCQVAKLAGRGLGHTGGTLDKLESIPGFAVDLTPAAFRAQVAEIGLAVAAAGDALVPADKRLYALRDVTGTVADTALVASSVMSKKIAGGARHLILDVKVGDGAFMPDRVHGVALGQLCVAIGEAAGRRTGALVTDMSQPLGPAVGNALEVATAVMTLRTAGGGRFRDVCVELATAALRATGVTSSRARGLVISCLEDGRALERFRAFVRAQGGDPRVADDPWSVLERAPVVRDWAPGPGYVAAVDGRRLGQLAVELGAGRRRRADTIDPAVGLEIEVAIGDELSEGQTAVRVHARREADAERVLSELPSVVALVEGPVAPPPLLHARLGAAAD